MRNSLPHMICLDKQHSPQLGRLFIKYKIPASIVLSTLVFTGFSMTKFQLWWPLVSSCSLSACIWPISVTLSRCGAQLCCRLQKCWLQSDHCLSAALHRHATSLFGYVALLYPFSHLKTAAPTPFTHAHHTQCWLNWFPVTTQWIPYLVFFSLIWCVTQCFSLLLWQSRNTQHNTNYCDWSITE